MPPPNPLQVHVYLTPALPIATGDPDPQRHLWSPTTCTLIHGPTTAILVDCPPTIPSTSDLADWITATAPGKTLKYFLATHAHGDHFLGLPTLHHRFPGLKFLATPAVAAGITHQLSPEIYTSIWRTWFPFPGQLHPASSFPTLEPLPTSGLIHLDGRDLRVYDAEQGDSSHNSFLHAPALDLLVAGDLVYGSCHLYLAEAATADKRAGWLNSLDAIEALRPRGVVPGHTTMTTTTMTRGVDYPVRWDSSGMELIAQTREYIRRFERELQGAESPGRLFARMREAYPERWNLLILERSCEGAFGGRD